ncbi:ImmA/IrrE family metallo-endopeptidase [Gloeocapsa sp. PCC 73106]|uniref:ImmA/IrrE family metallo-endopeptidase n=1 Tax=Gloeocapsa sp. PCC 73106 TaxID=102232 RepID=UPI0002ABD893|nr:ImmA/IrrE family metallo-endopeptidase [Gloeocapsa sp. PCC 73106]ELR97817.1 putative Zn peptidase [Gloeocapsa sp. PCC 73106]
MLLIQGFRFISKGEIEAIANQILIRMSQTPNYVPKWPLDASRVAEFLGLDLVWDRISEDEQGAIAARILPLEKLIEINEDILQLGPGFTESTIAHEVGHWVLHINHAQVERQSQVESRELAFLCRNQENLRGREWQAQYFASCLLMPKDQLETVIKGRNLEKWSDLYQIAAELGVSISNLIHRLKDLGWINITPDSRQISRLKAPLPRIREKIETRC